MIKKDLKILSVKSNAKFAQSGRYQSKIQEVRVQSSVEVFFFIAEIFLLSYQNDQHCVIIERFNGVFPK